MTDAADNSQRVLLAEVQTQINKFESSPPLDVATAISDMWKSQSLTLRLLFPLYAKSTNGDNGAEIKTKWFTIRGQAAMLPAIILAFLVVMAAMFLKVNSVEKRLDTRHRDNVVSERRP